MTEKIHISEEELFQVLEKKLMDLLSERENLIRDNELLSQELSALKKEKKENVQKLQLLVSLFTPEEITNDTSNSSHLNVAGTKPILVQA